MAVIGTAGRTPQQLASLSAESLEWMQRAVLGQIAAWGLDLSQVCLVSGASAWADHVAVLLYLRHYETIGGLRLYPPCGFDTPRRQFEDNGPGRVLNLYHRQHSNAVKRNTGDDIVAAVALGATMEEEGRGFHVRNSLVARCDYMVAMTFSPGEAPDKAHSPGTLDTWTKCRGKKKHFTVPTAPPR